MAVQLKSTVINMKSLSQDIADPIIVSAGDANGRVLRIIFTQEAAAQFTSSTKVYLSWKHQELDIKGYNVFTEITNDEDEDWPLTWEIYYPQAMLHEGNVLACIQIVDEISISSSVNFTIHILADPNEDSSYVYTDDYSEFQQAVINLNSLADQMTNFLNTSQEEVDDLIATLTELEEQIVTQDVINDLKDQHVADLTFYEYE